MRSEVNIWIKKYVCAYGARDNFGRSADGRYWTTGRGSPTVGEVHGCSFTSVDLFVLINGITVIVSTQSFNSALPDWFQENVHTGTYYTEEETKNYSLNNVLKLVEQFFVWPTLWVKNNIKIASGEGDISFNTLIKIKKIINTDGIFFLEGGMGGGNWPPSHKMVTFSLGAWIDVQKLCLVMTMLLSL